MPDEQNPRIAKDREFTIELGTEDGSEWRSRAASDPLEPIPLSLSSEYPVERYDWYGGEQYFEVLSHEASAVDLSRIGSGMAFLESHDRYLQMGRLINIRVKDRKLRGDLVFSRRAEAQALRQDMLDGIRTEVSITYAIDPDAIDEVRTDGVRTVTIKRWRPMEGSAVAIPADHTVGVGRSAEFPVAGAQRAHPVRAHVPPPALTRAEERTMPEELLVAAGAAAVGETVTSEGSAAGGGAPTPARATVGSRAVQVQPNHSEREAADEIAALAEAHGCQDKLPGWVRGRASVEQVRQDVIGILAERVKKGPQLRPLADLSEREEREYSMCRAILLDAGEDVESPGAGRSRENSIELEVSDEIERNLPSGYKKRGTRGSIFVPTTMKRWAPRGLRFSNRPLLQDVQSRAGLDSITSAKGLELKFTEYGGFIEMLRAKARVLQAGATYLGGLNAPTTFVKQNGAGTFSWISAENPGSDVADSNLLLTTVTLTPKTGMSSTSFSRQLLRLASEDIEGLVRNDISTIHGLGIDAGVLFGTGASGQPQGLFTLSGATVVSLGTNGAAPTYATAVQMRTEVAKLNADLGKLSLITTPGIKGTYMLTQKFSGTNGDPTWGDDDIVAGMAGFDSTQVQSNLTKGSGTNLHAMYAGVFSQALIGEWGAMEIVTDPYRLKKQGMIEVTSFQMIDNAYRNAGAFAVVKDAISQF